MYKKRLYFGIKIMVETTTYGIFVEGTIFNRVLIWVMRVDPRARAQKFGRFFNANQAR